MADSLMVIKRVTDLGKGINFIVTFDGREYSKIINTAHSWAVYQPEPNEQGKSYRGITDDKTIRRLDKAFSKAVFYGRQ
jgi:hypothetical protein